MAYDESTGIQADGDLLGGGETPDSQVLSILGRKDRLQILGRGEVHGIVKTGVSTDAALKASAGAVDLPQQLDLQPALSCLRDFRGRRGASKLSDAEEADGTDEIYQPLRHPHERTDLPDRLQAAAEDRRHTRQLGVERDRDLSA